MLVGKTTSKVISKTASTITREKNNHARDIKAKPICKNKYECMH